MRRADEAGQGMVEFALVLPVMVLLMIGLIDIGRAVFGYNTIANASRESARVAIVNQTSVDVMAEALKQSVSLGLTAADVAIAYGHPSGSGTCGTPIGVGCLATVSVTYQYQPATPLIGQIIGPITMSAATQMPVERTCPDPATPALVTCPWP